MAIRDGLTIDLDTAKTEAVVRKGKVRYVAPPAQPVPRRVMKIAAALLLMVLVLGAVYYFYTQRDVPDTLRMEVGKAAYGFGEEVEVSVFLQNTGPKAHSYVLSTTQSFGLEILNATGGIVAEYAPNATAGPRELSVGPGQTIRLGDFSWNQTVRGSDGENETWTQVAAGDYTIRAYFKGSADIAAEKRITIG
jgi:hypothetical protein